MDRPRAAREGQALEAGARRRGEPRPIALRAARCDARRGIEPGAEFHQARGPRRGYRFPPAFERYAVEFGREVDGGETGIDFVIARGEQDEERIAVTIHDEARHREIPFAATADPDDDHGAGSRRGALEQVREAFGVARQRAQAQTQRDVAPSAIRRRVGTYPAASEGGHATLDVAFHRVEATRVSDPHAHRAARIHAPNSIVERDESARSYESDGRLETFG